MQEVTGWFSGLYPTKQTYYKGVERLSTVDSLFLLPRKFITREIFVYYNIIKKGNMSKLKCSEVKNIIRFIYEEYIDGIEENTDEEGNIVGFTDEEGNVLGYKDENDLVEDFKLYVDVYKDYEFDWEHIKEGKIYGWNK